MNARKQKNPMEMILKVIAIALFIILAGLILGKIVNAGATPSTCPPLVTTAGTCLTDFPGVEPLVADSNDVPYPQAKLGTGVIADLNSWEQNYPGRTPPEGFPDEKWVVVLKIKVPNKTMIPKTYALETIWVWADHRVFANPPMSEADYSDSLYVGYQLNCLKQEDGGSSEPTLAITIPAQKANIFATMVPIIPRATDRIVVNLVAWSEAPACSYP